MTIKALLAAYSGDAKGSGGLKYAIALANRFDAFLTGVVWHGPSRFEQRYQPYLTDQILEMLAARDAEVVAEIRADFENRIAAEGMQARSAFLDLQGVGDFRLSDCARGYDLTVIGSQAAEVGREHFSARPDVVALRSGRPVMLVPTDHEPARALPGKRILVAWDGQRAVTRALADALPLLDSDAEITVLTVGEREQWSPGDDVMGFLGRHGLKAERLIRARAESISKTIMAVSRDIGAELIVMGAYEHSKFREDLFGGVTQEVVELARVPVLMAH